MRTFCAAHELAAPSAPTTSNIEVVGDIKGVLNIVSHVQGALRTLNVFRRF